MGPPTRKVRRPGIGNGRDLRSSRSSRYISARLVVTVRRAVRRRDESRNDGGRSQLDCQDCAFPDFTALYVAIPEIAGTVFVLYSECFFMFDSFVIHSL